MKRILALSALLTPSLFASQSEQLALRDYARRSLAQCPGATLSLKPLAQQGPANFVVHEVTLDSTDEHCRTRRLLIYSPRTQQIILGSVILLPADNRPLNVKIGEQASQMLKRAVTATVSRFPLPDGLRGVTITKPTPYGAFDYHAYADASERFLLIGTRGNLKIDPAKTLRDALGLERTASRGNSVGKVEIIELSDFQCPTCARAHKKLEPLIVKNLSKIHYKRLDLPLFESHEWALPAALAARAIQKVAPSKYWKFVDYVFANQEMIGKYPSFDKVLRDFAEDHDIPWKALAPIYGSEAERRAMLAQVERAFDAGINSTPTFIINGQVTGFGDGTYVYEAIRKAVGAK